MVKKQFEPEKYDWYNQLSPMKSMLVLRVVLLSVVILALVEWFL